MCFIVECLIRGDVFGGDGGSDIENMKNHENILAPTCRREAILKEISVDCVVDFTNQMFRLPFCWEV